MVVDWFHDLSLTYTARMLQVLSAEYDLEALLDE